MQNDTLTFLPNRRQLLRAAGIVPLTLATRPGFAAPESPLPVAGVISSWHRNSHADVIFGKILAGFDQMGGAGPDLKLVAAYVDQVPANDMSRDLAKQHGFRIARTIDEAVTLGTDRVQVAGVISVGEHGNYETTADTKQKKYPRRRFFDGIAAAFRRCGSVVPVFNDKHLSWNWRDAKHIYDTVQKMKIPMMAGSSLPVAWREPPVMLPRGCEIEAALAVGYGGLESYGFHALEALQCMVERRRGGECGVKAVQTVQGDAIAEAEQQGKWSRSLLDAVLAVTPEVRDGDRDERLRKSASFYLIEYNDGLKATVAMANGLARHFGVAIKLKGRDEPIATWFKLEETRPFGHFAWLLRAIDHMIHTGQPAYPVERTLLTTGILDTALRSLAKDSQRIATPELAIAYDAVNWPHAPADK